MLFNLLLLLCGYLMPGFKVINDFKSPETDSVLKDFLRLLCNIKVKVLSLSRSLYLLCYILLVYCLY